MKKGGIKMRYFTIEVDEIILVAINLEDPKGVIGA